MTMAFSDARTRTPLEGVAGSKRENRIDSHKAAGVLRLIRPSAPDAMHLSEFAESPATDYAI
ncbi:MAG: hypothetical protein JOZ58_23450 [Acetobacteraceae bacterium]|nr:hypothetical protein [Acetobacteraceae bacterium]